MRSLSIFAFLVCIVANSSLSYAEKPVNKVINDSWYTMQAGSAPWGYFREIIEVKDGKYSYRYAMKKVESQMVYEETIGALSDLDLTPIAFSLTKAGAGATEMTNATYSKSKFGGVFNISVQGKKSVNLKRNVSNDTILDVFFPIWLTKQWSKIKPGYKGWLHTFAEDADKNEFRSRMVRFAVKDKNTKDDCMNIEVSVDSSVKLNWCMTKDGVVKEVKGGGFLVKQVKSEAEAKAFIAGVLPKQNN